MVRALKILAWPVVLVAVLMAGMGCPPYTPPPNYLVSFLITPTSLDFGTTTNTLKLKVAKNYTQQPLPEFEVSPGSTSWLSVTPKTGTSSGPNDVVVFTVTVDRSKMSAGENSGQLSISAPGVAVQTVDVTANAFLVADFSASPLVANVNEFIQFQDESTIAEGNIASWLWTFGDGKSSTAPSPRHKYKQPGAYNVSLTVSTDGPNGVSDTKVRQNYITIEGEGGPNADFVASDTTPPANTPVQFTDLSSPGSDTITDWFWTFGDGGSSTDPNPTHTYSLTGKFTVSLTVTTDTGAEDTETKSKYIDVQAQGPTAAFTADDRTIRAGNSVQFFDLSDPGSGTISNWLWTFGDGGTSTVQNPAHLYAASGTYAVYLSVSTEFGSDAVTLPNYIVVSP